MSLVLEQKHGGKEKNKVTKIEEELEEIHKALESEKHMKNLLLK